MPIDRPGCLGCDREMMLTGDRWTCPECGWWLPNRELCPRCWTLLPEEEGPGGEKVCPTCGMELWPPRDGEAPKVLAWASQPIEPPKVTLTQYDGDGRVVRKVEGQEVEMPPPPPPPLPAGGPAGGKSRSTKSKRKKSRKPLRRKGWENPMMD